MARQGSMTPLEFFSKLEDMYYKANISVAPSTLRTKILSGLDTNIRDQLEILPIKDLNTLTHTAMQIHAQLSRRKSYTYSSGQQRYSSNSSGLPYTNVRPSASTTVASGQAAKAKPATTTVTALRQNPPRQAPVPTDRARDIECYKCGGRGHYKKDCPNARKVLFSTAAAGFESCDEEEALPRSLKKTRMKRTCMTANPLL